MRVATRAGVFYALVVFLIGFIFGTVRVLLVLPRVGETVAVSLETPVMLAASWLVCRWCVDWLDVPGTIPARSVMGTVAFVVLMAAEFSLSVAMFGRSTAEHLASYTSLPGAIGLAAQLVFGTFPIAQVWRR